MLKMKSKNGKFYLSLAVILALFSFMFFFSTEVSAEEEFCYCGFDPLTMMEGVYCDGSLVFECFEGVCMDDGMGNAFCESEEFFEPDTYYCGDYDLDGVDDVVYDDEVTGGMMIQEYCLVSCVEDGMGNAFCEDMAYYNDCTDSDGGFDLYVKGHTTGVDIDGNYVDHHDSCTVGTGGSSNGIIEGVCDSDGILWTTYDTCANGCVDGACVLL